MIVPLSKLGPEGATFDGEDPVEVLAWDPSPRDVVRAAGPMRWRVKAQLFGSELVCTGRADALFEGVCCRCGGSLSRRFGDEFAISRRVAEGDTEADLTSEIRETILLALPNHPVCSDDCPGPPVPKARVAGVAGERAGEGGADPWSALDALSGGTTHENKRPRTRKTQNNNNK